jgi:menaquinone-dependent protoporphyrinogen oxidase
MKPRGGALNPEVLVVFDTKNGSTAGVAEVIAARLREDGVPAEVRAVRAAKDLSGLALLVVGAPLYSGRWLAGGHRLLKRLGKMSLESRPQLAVFALGPRSDEGPESWARPREQFQRALAKHPSVKPVSTALFGGADPPRKKLRRDIRDWEAIRAWADDIAQMLDVSDRTEAG